MIEVRIHGRGGQGNVVAAYLLAAAAFVDGWHVQAFPNFGAERRGAPVTAFVRAMRQPFFRRCQIQTPDFVILQDVRLMKSVDVTSGLKEHGGVLINAREAVKLPCASCIALDASRMAREILGHSIPNVALVSAFLSLTGLASRDALRCALAERFSGDALEKNLLLAKRSADAVPQGAWRIEVVAGD